MKINQQRLNQWLSGEIAAYNDGTPESIAMIKELCGHAKIQGEPEGYCRFYYHSNGFWYATIEAPKMPNKPVSWFFEAEDEPANPSIEQRLESIEKTLDEIRAFLVL